MTQSIDTFLIHSGFDADDLRTVQHRSALYVMIMIAGISAVTFTSLAITAWF